MHGNSILLRTYSSGRQYHRHVHRDVFDPSIPYTDIRLDYELSGGNLLDMRGVVSLARVVLYMRSLDAIRHAIATVLEDDPHFDDSMVATMRITPKAMRLRLCTAILRAAVPCYPCLQRCGAGHTITRSSRSMSGSNPGELAGYH